MEWLKGKLRTWERTKNRVAKTLTLNQKKYEHKFR